jgi:DNA replication protein DnaC
MEERQRFAKACELEYRIQESNIPRHTMKYDINDFTVTSGNRKALEIVTAFMAGDIDPPLVLLIGIPGVGKTTLAYRAAWAFLNNGERVVYYQAEELLNELQSRIEDSKAYGQLWARLKAADLVVLDDLAAQNRTPWRDAQLDALVDYRYRERRSLFMTTNKLNTISERILDRVKEGSSAVITGESWRGKAKQ